MATTYELSFFETDAGLTGTDFTYGFDALTSDDVRISGYVGDEVTDLSSNILFVNTSTKTLTLSSAPTGYDKIRIYRSTTVVPLVDFTNGAVLSGDSLNTAYRQSLFAAQEVSQDASDTGGRTAVLSSNIANLSITTSKLADDAVTSTKIADNAIFDEHITAGAVTTVKIDDLAVNSAKLSSDSVTTIKLVDEAVTEAKLADTLDLSGKTITLPSVNNPFSKELFHIVEEWPTNTAAGTSVALTQNIRALNTVVVNDIIGASLNAGTYQITLPAGEYIVEYASPAYKANAFCSVLYKLSPDTPSIIANGNNAYSNTTDASMAYSHGASVFVIGSTTVIQLRTYTESGKTTDGLGLPVNLAGRNERYSSIKIWKIA